MLECTVLYALAIYMIFFLCNYAELFSDLRNWLFPKLHPKAAYAVQCPVCFSFWSLSAMSLFTGFTPLVLCVPPVCLFMDLTFQKLRDGCK